MENSIFAFVLQGALKEAMPPPTPLPTPSWGIGHPEWCRQVPSLGVTLSVSSIQLTYSFELCL